MCAVLIFAYRCIKAALAAPDRFDSSWWSDAWSIVIQAFVNIGVVTIVAQTASRRRSSCLAEAHYRESVAVALIMNVGWIGA